MIMQEKIIKRTISIVISSKNCKLCGNEFEGEPNCKYCCDECKRLAKLEQDKMANRRQRDKKKGILRTKDYQGATK